MDPNTQKAYGAIYAYVKASKLSACMYQTLQLVRRIFYALSIVFLSANPGVQLMIQMYTSLLMMIYLQVVQPYQERIDNIFDLINEIFIFSVFLLLTVNAQGVYSPDLRYSLGYLILSIIFLVILLNFGLFFFETFQKIWKRREKYLSWLKKKFKTQQQQIPKTKKGNVKGILK